MACLFGHKWNGCKCEKCGQIRDQEHQFKPLTGLCEEICDICGETRSTPHSFRPIPGKDEEECSICGETIAVRHKMKGNKCVLCGRTKAELSAAFAQEIEEGLAGLDNEQFKNSIETIAKTYGGMKDAELLMPLCEAYGNSYKNFLSDIQDYICKVNKIRYDNTRGVYYNKTVNECKLILKDLLAGTRFGKVPMFMYETGDDRTNEERYKQVIDSYVDAIVTFLRTNDMNAMVQLQTKYAVDWVRNEMQPALEQQPSAPQPATIEQPLAATQQATFEQQPASQTYETFEQQPASQAYETFEQQIADLPQTTVEMVEQQPAPIQQPTAEITPAFEMPLNNEPEPIAEMEPERVYKASPMSDTERLLSLEIDRMLKIETDRLLKMESESQIEIEPEIIVEIAPEPIIEIEPETIIEIEPEPITELKSETIIEIEQLLTAESETKPQPKKVFAPAKNETKPSKAGAFVGNSFNDPAWKDSMKVRLDFNNMLTDYVGREGISLDDINAIRIKIERAKKAMLQKRTDGGMDWRDLPYNQADVVEDIVKYVNESKKNFDAFVVLGIGGSALGPMAVQQAINHPYYNELTKTKRGGYPKFYVADNVDPERLVYLFETIDIKKSLFNVISKSGSTSETMSQFMIIKELLEQKLGKVEAKKHIVCTTDSTNGNLIKIANDEGYKKFIIPSGVGGRFSELTPVGLLPAAFCGVDIEQMLAGAAYMDELCKNDDVFKNPAYMYAVLNYIGMQRGKNISVMMPYADSLKFISAWYAQLWAESLGKKFDIDGNVVNVGPTPVAALGVTDQHSQVQLYTEGPFDKMIVFMGVDNYKQTITIPKIYGDIPSLGFLGGVTQNELIKVEQMATEYALLKSGKMNMTITLPHVNEFTVGQIIYLFEVATGFAGELMNINAFDQPGVEEGKNATYAFFGRPGYEAKKKELEEIPAKKEEFII